MKKEQTNQDPAVRKNKQDKDKSYYFAVGRRREAHARVKLYVVNSDSITIGEHNVKKGEILVNKRAFSSYFPGSISERIGLEPFRTTNTVGRYAVVASIEGGGLSGQLDAFTLGVSRALVKVDNEKFRPILKKKGFLTRDPRMKERRKAGFAQKARARKQSPKR